MKILKSHKIETKRCLLRIASREDIPHILSATRHNGFNNGMRWDPPAADTELEEPYKKNIAAWEDGAAYCFTIEKRGSMEFIGRIVIRREDGNGIWSLGFWTHPIHQGKGFMAEAVAPIVGFGFSSLSASSIEACHALWNKASERVLLKVGMHFVRHIPQGFHKQGEWVEENLLSITKEQWERQQSNKALQGTQTSCAPELNVRHKN
jgi:[ribosomal protein S5]-alanine N-acetyltransferase